jgi:hypothetical protein
MVMEIRHVKKSNLTSTVGMKRMSGFSVNCVV